MLLFQVEECKEIGSSAISLKMSDACKSITRAKHWIKRYPTSKILRVVISTYYRSVNIYFRLQYIMQQRKKKK